MQTKTRGILRSGITCLRSSMCNTCMPLANHDIRCSAHFSELSPVFAIAGLCFYTHISFITEKNLAFQFSR